MGHFFSAAPHSHSSDGCTRAEFCGDWVQGWRFSQAVYISTSLITSTPQTWRRLDLDRGIPPLLVLWGYIHILFFASKYANAYLDKHLSENPAKGERQKKNLPQWLISTWGAQLCCDKTSSGPMRWWLQTEWQLHVSKQKNPNAPQPCLISANRG